MEIVGEFPSRERWQHRGRGCGCGGAVLPVAGYEDVRADVEEPSGSCGGSATSVSESSRASPEDNRPTLGPPHTPCFGGISGCWPEPPNTLRSPRVSAVNITARLDGEQTASKQSDGQRGLMLTCLVEACGRRRQPADVRTYGFRGVARLRPSLAVSGHGRLTGG